MTHKPAVSDETDQAQEPMLDDIKITDQDLEAADSQKSLDKKTAKKRAKQLRTPEEAKRVQRRRLAVAGGLLVLLLAVVFTLPFTRWPLLNTLGFRGSLELKAQEYQAASYISDASVLLDGQSVGATDVSGTLRLNNIRLGSHQLTLHKAGYSREQQTVVVGLGTATHRIKLQAIGVRLSLKVKNWLTGQPLAGAVVRAANSKAQADSKGLATLVVPPASQKTKLTVSAKGYLEQTVLLDTNVVSRDVALVAAAKNYFITERRGSFDIFSVQLDGSRPKRLVEGTGNEVESLLQFSVHPGNKTAVLVATREAKRQNGRLVAGVYRVDLTKASLTKLDEGSDIQLLGWSGDSLVYSKAQPQLNYNDRHLSQLVGLNVVAPSRTVYAEANYFASAEVAADKLFYMPADGYRPLQDAQLTAITIASGARQQYLKDEQVNYLAQTAYGQLQLETVSSKRYQLNVLNNVLTAVDAPPGQSKRFAKSPFNDQVAWTERRDGQGSLMVKDLSSGRERLAAKTAGLTSPLRWVSSNLVVVRVATSEETADYVIDVSTGKFAKISDVSNVGQSYQTGL